MPSLPPVSARDARFPLVDSLRAIAALSVFAYHCAFVLGALDGDGLGPWLAELNVGVTLFFAISGFLLYRPYVAARLGGAPLPKTGAYAARRVLRIVPAYWVALTLITLATGRWDVFELRGLLTYYGFLQSYRADTIVGGIGQAWTLGAEVAFYALLPLLAWTVRRVWAPADGTTLPAEVALLVGLFGLSVAWKVAVAEAIEPASGAFFPLLIALPGQLDQFALGMGLATASVVLGTRESAPPRAVRTLERAPAFAWLAAALAFGALGAHWHVGGQTGRILSEHALQGLVALGLLLPAVIGAECGGAVRRLLSRKLLAWIGLISYGVYLWHLDILRELSAAELPASLVVITGLGLSLAAGAASWYGLERRALRLGRRLSGRPPREPRPADPAPTAPSV